MTRLYLAASLRSATFVALAAACLAAGTAGCGGDDNAADCEGGVSALPCSPLEREEAARQAMDRRDYDTAVTLLEELVAEEPEDYQRYALLAAAHAARGGFAVLSIVKANFSGGGGLLTQLTAFLPDPAELGLDGYKNAVTDMGLAVARLNAIPVALRDQTSEETYAKSVQLQLMLYQSAYSVMYLNQFVLSSTTGAFDPALLATMTEADALVVLTNLAAAGTAQGDNPELQAKIDGALNDIQGEAGASNRDKLSAYIVKEQNQ